MTRGLAALVVLAACGRSGFGPIADGDPGAASDATDDAATDAGGPLADAGPCVALHFLGDTDGVTIPSSTDLDFGAAATLEAWVLLDDPGETSGNVFTRWTMAQEDSRIDVFAEMLHGSFYDGSLQTLTTEPIIPLGTWTHLASSFDGTAWRLFVGGAELAIQGGAFTVQNGGGDGHIGSIFRDGARTIPLHGFIASVRISSVARYTASFTPAPVLAADGQTQALWNLDEGTGSIAEDSTGHGNAGVISGASWIDAPCRE